MPHVRVPSAQRLDPLALCAPPSLPPPLPAGDPAVHPPTALDAHRRPSTAGSLRSLVPLKPSSLQDRALHTLLPFANADKNDGAAGSGASTHKKAPGRSLRYLPMRARFRCAAVRHDISCIRQSSVPSSTTVSRVPPRSKAGSLHTHAVKASLIIL